MEPLRVLLFAYHFPPETEIGAARPFRFYHYLSRLGYTCNVITAARQLEPSSNRIMHVPDPYRTSSRKRFKWQLERLLRWGCEAAVGLEWSHDAYLAARTLMRTQPAARTIILSTFPPLGVHLAAKRLAREEGLPWIADFRDPITGASAQAMRGHERVIRRWLERNIVSAADRVIANTDTVQRNWQKDYPTHAERIHLIWNGFDPEHRIAGKPLPARSWRMLTHIGELYAGRTVGPIAESLNRLIEERHIPAGSVRLRLVGEAESSALGARERVARAQTRGWLELSAAVPQAQAHEIMQTSDYLLLIQQQSATQVPGKLFEYLQIGRPILAFVLPDSPTERILARSGVPYRCVYPGDSPERMDAVLAEFLSLPTDIVPANAWFEEHFNGEKQVRELAEIMQITTRS